MNITINRNEKNPLYIQISSQIKEMIFSGKLVNGSKLPSERQLADNLKVHRNNHFYCAEFVKYVLENSVGGIELPEIIKPEDFEEIKGLELIYTGVLRKYKM